MEDVSHKQIYDRLVAVERKVDKIDSNTADVVVAFQSAKGAFLVLEWIAKLAKPIIWTVGAIVALVTAYEKWWNK